MFDDWRDGIHPWVRASTEAAVRAGGLRLHDHTAAVNSSMGFGFNLIMPFREHGQAKLGELLGSALNCTFEVSNIDFEFHGPTDVLAECAGATPRAKERFTASDVAVHVTDEAGRRGVVLIEVKLSEGGFSSCNGSESPANGRRDVCASAATFFDAPNACYLRRTRHARRDRRYWDILGAEFGSVQGAVPGYTGQRCPFEGDHQQIMRNHALALGLVQAGEVDFSALGLVHHPENHHVVEPWELYRKMVADDTSLFRIPANTIVDAVANQPGQWRDWGRYMRERYMLPHAAGEVA